MSRLEKVADLCHKVIGAGLIGFTVVGSLNLITTVQHKQRKYARVNSLLEQETTNDFLDTEFSKVYAK
ncbi:hypothetical protein HDV06_002336 [Boothiomyces sp. JEL0866]|nr:hypothetical protein HDV06_002336 [Boothiomyces sp. JEL0866]